MKTESEGIRAAGACDSHAPSAAPDRGELPLGLVHNVRDLGGLAFTDEDGGCGTTAAGVFLRAPSLRRLREADFAFLRSYGDGGLARVVDLRSGFEVSHWPDPYAGGRDGVVYTHVPMLDNDGASIAQVMTALDSDGASGCALFHCRAGKDRTGVIAMLLLGLAGVSDGDIVADYAATQRYLGRGLRAQRVAVSIALRRRAPRCLFEAVPSEMELTLVHLHERYGTARAYLEGHAGISPQVLDRLAGRLRGM